MKKNYYLLMLMALILFSCSKQKSEFSFTHGLDYIPVDEDNEECIYLDINTGKKAKKSKTYEWASYFYDGIAVVKVNGSYRFINDSFEYISNDEYSQFTYFNNGIAYAVKPSGRITAINKKGETVFTLQNAEKAYPFNDEGVSIFETEDGKFGLVNAKGKILLETKEKDQLISCVNGMAIITTETKAGTKYGIIDYDNKEIIPCEYDAISFTYDKDRFIARNDDKVGVIDQENKEIIPFEYEYIVLQHDGNYLVAKKYRNSKMKIGWLNRKGEEIIEPQFGWATPFLCNNLTPVYNLDEEKIIYIDEKSECAIDSKFEYAEFFFDNGLAIVKNGNTLEYGAIDESGEYIIKSKYEKLRYLGNDLYYAELEDKSGIINSKGEEVIKLNDLYDYNLPCTSTFAKHIRYYYYDSEYKLNDYTTNITECTSYVSNEYIDVDKVVNQMIADIKKINIEKLTISQLEKDFNVKINEKFVKRWNDETLYEAEYKDYTATIQADIDPITQYSYFYGYSTTYKLGKVKVYFNLYEKALKNSTSIQEKLIQKLGLESDITEEEVFHYGPIEIIFDYFW